MDIEYEPHPLDNSSPLIRALPMYERDFRGHALRAKAFAEAGRTRLLQARQLLLEMVPAHHWTLTSGNSLLAL